MRLVKASISEVEFEVGNSNYLLLSRGDYDEPWELKCTMLFDDPTQREMRTPEELEKHIRDSFASLLTDFDKDKFINLMSLLP